MAFGGLGTNLERAVADIRGNRRLQEDANRHLGVRWLGAQLEVGVTQALAHRVDTDEGASAEEVLALQGAWSHRVLLGPDAVHVLREELGGGDLVTRVAASRGLGSAEVGRALISGFGAAAFGAAAFMLGAAAFGMATLEPAFGLVASFLSVSNPSNFSSSSSGVPFTAALGFSKP